MRKTLNPLFTAANTRDMITGMYEVAHKVGTFFHIFTCSVMLRQLSQKIDDAIASSGTSSAIIDGLKLSSATAMDMIGSVALGHDFEALGEETEYAKVAKQFSQVSSCFFLTFSTHYVSIDRLSAPFCLAYCSSDRFHT